MHSPLSNPQNSKKLLRQKKEGLWIFLFFGNLPFISLWRVLPRVLTKPVIQVLQICKLTSSEWKQRQTQLHIYCKTIFCFTITILFYNNNILFYNNNILFYNNNILFYNNNILFYNNIILFYKNNILFYNDNILFYNNNILFYNNNILFYNTLRVSARKGNHHALHEIKNTKRRRNLVYSRCRRRCETSLLYIT
jgi:hypothetical protein